MRGFPDPNVQRKSLEKRRLPDKRGTSGLPAGRVDINFFSQRRELNRGGPTNKQFRQWTYVATSGHFLSSADLRRRNLGAAWAGIWGLEDGAIAIATFAINRKREGQPFFRHIHL